MSHYFAARPTVASRPVEIRAKLRGRSWAFLTDRGVFARGGIDPGTRLLIEAMDIGPEDRVLDLGCGYGAVGLVAAALASAGHAVLVDVNERAVALAQENARRNGITNVEVLHGDGCTPVAGRQFDAIVSNPPIRAGKTLLRRLIHEVFDHLRSGGRFFFVARTAQGAQTLARDVAAILGNVKELERESGYRVFEATKTVEELES